MEVNLNQSNLNPLSGLSELTMSKLFYSWFFLRPRELDVFITKWSCPSAVCQKWIGYAITKIYFYFTHACTFGEIYPASKISVAGHGRCTERPNYWFYLCFRSHWIYSTRRTLQIQISYCTWSTVCLEFRVYMTIVLNIHFKDVLCI